MANKDKHNRIILFEPNPAENKLIPNEDLSILVELYATRKGRTIIRDGSLDSASRDQKINFIAGTKISSDGKRVSLTTDYTEKSPTESLGIENIQIDFDTAYTPLIKIKFIDVRGNSVFSQSTDISNTGNPDSDYSVFFDFPYPLFELVVKGFYGKPVSYCLHLTKFTSSFNSSTGNFEIETEFIGYTYAILTDMLLGLIRAVITTPEGRKNWERKVAKYAAAGITLKSIDEFIDDISKLADEFKKIANNDKNSEQLNINAETREALDKIETKLNSLLNNIVPNGTDYSKSKAGIAITSTDRKNVIDNLIKNFKEEIKTFVDGENGINSKIKEDDLKIKTNDITKIINFRLKRSEINNETDLINTIISKKSSEYSKNTTEEEDRVKNLAVLILQSNIKDLPDNSIIEVYDLRTGFNEVLGKQEDLNDSDSRIRETLGKELAEISEQELQFSPTIRNITRILTAHCEVFMETLQEVSESARNNKSRDKVLKTAFVDDEQKNGQFGGNENNETIYPWPEYNEKVTDENGEPTYQEAWLGSKLDYNQIQQVPELVFTENLLAELLRLKQKDNETIKENKFKGVNYYPVSPLDNPIFFPQITKNPYEVALTTGRANDGLRLLLLRGFLLLGLSNKSLSNLNIETFGKLEAENLADSISEFDETISNELIQQIAALDSEQLIQQGEKGWGNIKNPKGNSPKGLYTSTSNTLTYDYIGTGANGNPRWFIPIDKNFDGQVFYNSNNNLITPSDTLYTSGQNVALNNTKTGNAVYFKIIETSSYEGKDISPDYGSEIISSYNEKQPGKFIKQSSFEDEELKDLNPFSGSKKYTEITDLIYDEGDQGGSYQKAGASSQESSVLSSFFYEWESGGITRGREYKVGTYLSKGYNKENRFYKSEVKPTVINTKEFLESYEMIKSNDIVRDRGRKISSFPENWGQNRELIGYNLGNINDSNSSEVKIYTPFIEFNVLDKFYSLFGSKFYYGQNSDVAKGFLFLSTFKFYKLDDDNIINLFTKNASYIKVPKLWAAYIGGVLYRLDQTNDILTFTNTQADTNLAPNGSDLLKIDGIKPQKDEYLYQNYNLNYYSSGMNFRGEKSALNFFEADYEKIGFFTKNLKYEVREEFKRIFRSFISNEFKTIRENFEIATNLNDLAIKWQNLRAYTGSVNPNTSNLQSALQVDGIEIDRILNTYENISVIDSPDYINGERTDVYSEIFLRIKEGGNGNELINELYRGSYYIINGNVEALTWNPGGTDIEEIKVDKSKMTTFLTGFFTRIKEIAKDFSEQRQNKLDKLKQEIYNTTDDDFIKLSIYRTLASINTKWLGGTNCKDNNPFKQCTCKTGSENTYDKIVAENEKVLEPDLIHSFRFVDSAYNDIGDTFYINPFYVQKLILGNFNQSFFDLINQILIDNNFNFIALPNFINYNDLNDVTDVFNTFTYSDVIQAGKNNIISGPSFVCQYIGQTSTTLSTPFNDYKDDGIYIRLDENGKIIKSTIPPHYGTSKKNNGDLSLPVFLVSYGLQNQSFFKDISISQQETTESLESLQLIEDLSLSADKRKPTFKGQNLWNVYQKRQYKVEIEMMGNAMIQPFMYFQLDDIPLFRGMYAIYKTSHTITPNNMTTKFSGIKTKRFRTPLIKKEDFFMSLISGLNELSDKRNTSSGSTETFSSNYITNTDQTQIIINK
jgi:hypothetical protein